MFLHCFLLFFYFFSIKCISIDDDKFEIFSSSLVNNLLQSPRNAMAYEMFRLKLDKQLSRANISIECKQFIDVFMDELERGAVWAFKCKNFNN